MKHLALTLCALLIAFSSAKADTVAYCKPHARTAEGWIVSLDQREFRICGNGRVNSSGYIDLQTTPFIGDRSLLSAKGTGFQVLSNKQFTSLPDRIKFNTRINGKPKKLRTWEGRDYFGWETQTKTPNGINHSLDLFWPPIESQSKDAATALPLHRLICGDLNLSARRKACSLNIADGDLTFHISLYPPSAPLSLQEPIPNITQVIKDALTIYRAAEVTDANRAELTNVPRFTSH